jgi:hypothetical protein
MATRHAACHLGSFAWKPRAIRLQSRSATASPANVEPGVPSGCAGFKADQVEITGRCPELWWDSARPLYGKYADAADRGRELIEAYPGQGHLYYNVACCESLGGRTADAIDHLRQAVDMWEGCRDMAKADADFDPIRDDPAFQKLIGR